MLSITLNTNEVRNAAGTEVEFQSIDKQAREHVFAQITEQYALPHRLKVGHQESGKGISSKRRSVARIDKTVMSTVDTTKTCTVSAYKVLEVPIGALLSTAEAANVLAELDSFTATSGGAILLDGTGNGNAALLSGGL